MAKFKTFDDEKKGFNGKKDNKSKTLELKKRRQEKYSNY